MDINKNSYTFGFAAIMVVVVAALLSFAATSLKPLQQKNVALEKKQNILRSIGVEVGREEADESYDKFIKKALVIKGGEVQSEAIAFDVDLSKQIDKAPEKRLAPLYIAQKDGKEFYILPMRGKGLWGPIWGYLALQEDVNTVFGAIFDHKSETPGLGAEISTPVFMDQFQGKKILDESGKFVSIEVRKGNATGDYQVDGISGGTITSVGVQDMLDNSVRPYLDFLKSYSSKPGTAGSTNTDQEEIAIIE